MSLHATGGGDRALEYGEPGASAAQALDGPLPPVGMDQSTPEARWGWTQSLGITRGTDGDHMFPMTVTVPGTRRVGTFHDGRHCKNHRMLHRYYNTPSVNFRRRGKVRIAMFGRRCRRCGGAARNGWKGGNPLPVRTVTSGRRLFMKRRGRISTCSCLICWHVPTCPVKVLRWLREETAVNSAVLFATSRDSEEDIVCARRRC